MITTQTFKISGVGKYVPERRVTSEQLENELNLLPGWVMKNVGVQTRYQVKEETNTDMAVKALSKAMQAAGIMLKDLDCLIAASATFDHVLPNRSALIKHRFKEGLQTHFPTLDINTACTSFITASDYAAYLITSGQCKHVAIVSSEISSKGLDSEDPETYCLFGDCAASVIFSSTNKENDSYKYALKTYSSGASNTFIEGGGNAKHFRDNPYTPALYSFKMEGRSLLRLASSCLPDFLNDFFRDIPFSLTDVDLIIPHQASKMGLKMLNDLNENRPNVLNILPEYGNCIAASIPFALVHAIEKGRLKPGQTCLLLGTAAGMNISAMLFKYIAL